MVPTAVAPPPEGWPEFGYQGVITDKSQMDYNPTNEYIFPSVFHAGAHFENPLGEWYLYTAPHDSPAGVLLMYADSLEGPWIEYGSNPIIASEWLPHYDVSHTSSPDAIWNEEAGKMFMYFHGENSVTRYATSDDGIHFEYGDIVVSNAMGGPNVTETSYARVFEHPDPASGFAYGMFYMGNERDNIRRIRLAESVDGITWTVDPDYVVAPSAERARTSRRAICGSGTVSCTWSTTRPAARATRARSTRRSVTSARCRSSSTRRAVSAPMWAAWRPPRS